MAVKAKARARVRKTPAGKALSGKAPIGDVLADNARPKRAAAKTKTASKPPKPDVLLQHVFGTIEGELKKLDSHKGASSQDRERASRALTQMVNSLEKAVEMQRDITKAKSKGRGAKDKEALAHADDLRREIAERIEKLQRKRSAE